MAHLMVTMNYNDDAGFPTPQLPVREVKPSGTMRTVTVIIDESAKHPGMRDDIEYSDSELERMAVICMRQALNERRRRRSEKKE